MKPKGYYIIEDDWPVPEFIPYDEEESEDDVEISDQELC